MSPTESQTIFTEVFPVQVSALPQLYAYQLDMGGGNRPTVGGKLSYRLRKLFKGHWAWSNNRILTDKLLTSDEIRKVVEELWKEQPDVFKDLRAVNQDTHWKPTSQYLAEFVARGLFVDVDAYLRKILSEKTQDLGNASLERVYEARGWVVQDEPAVSISISSRLVHKQDVKAYSSTLSNPEELVGLSVADKASSLKGEIVGIVGKMSEHRKRLLAITQSEEMQEILRKAQDDELVVRVLSGRNEYDYAVSALRIIVYTEDFSRFKINSQQALRAMRMEPKFRSDTIKEISDLVKQKKLVDNSYNSAKHPHLFVTTANMDPVPKLRLGGNQVRACDQRNLLRNLRECGLYKRSQKFQSGAPIRIGVINALGSSLDTFLSKLHQELNNLDFKVEFVAEEKLAAVSREAIESCIGRLHEKSDILLAFFEDEYNEDEEEWGTYRIFKSLTVGKGVASQVVYHSTLSNQYAIANIVLGILGKTGNIPFVLAEPLEFADLVVGIDIAREQKKRLPGSINATAIARIYFQDGEFLHYVIQDAPLEGETIPDDILRSLFPSSEFKGKRVVIHRDGIFRGGEKQALVQWAEKIGAKFHLVEVIKTGTPRIYASQQGKVVQPLKGSVFKLSEVEAFLVSTLPPFADATPMPLRIKTDGTLSIEQGITSILSLTLLHYGSVRSPKLPVTTHYSDRIAYLALRGIKPKNLEGNIPFWL